MKTREERNVLKKKTETVSKQPRELMEDELAEVTGGLNGEGTGGIKTLTQLSKNQSSLSKSLAKLSDGMKINSAANDPSGYQIG